MHIPGRKQRINCISLRKIATAPAAAITLPGHGGAQILFRLVFEADETHHRQVAPGVVMVVEKPLVSPGGWGRRSGPDRG